MTDIQTALPALDPAKFRDPLLTLDGEKRASVELHALETLWFATGTLCNLACTHCYIESSPTNDQLVYLSIEDVTAYLDEIGTGCLPTRQIGFTGGEPFMNPDILPMIETCFMRGFEVLVLSNGMLPMQRPRVRDGLLDLQPRFGGQFTIRISLDHYTQRLHEIERGPGSWEPALAGLKWLSASGFIINVAGRTCWGDSDEAARDGYAALFASEGIAVDAYDPAALVLFPEMDPKADVPEITTGCWDILGKNPADMMCATSRMVVKRKGAARPSVVACTLLPYDPRFELGRRLADASGPVRLNHPHCAKFCVLGGASCSAG